MTVTYVPSEKATPRPRFRPAVIMHGGAGNIERSRIPPELYEKYRASLLKYLRSTLALLNGEQGESGDGNDGSPGSALDAAVHAVSLMEDDEIFNCGRGSVFTTTGTHEMEASVMVCSLLPESQGSADVKRAQVKRGAGVMMIKNVRHPVQLAREVLLRDGEDDAGKHGGSMHSHLCGPYVEALAKEWGLEFKPDEWFFTQKRWDEHIRGLGKGATIDHDGAPESIQEINKYLSQGTVGCVCLDQWGNIAAATSTGGLTNKLPGRIGDTPTLGAGFWAESWDAPDSSSRRALGMSGTGNGDSFVRVAAAHSAASLVKLGTKVSLADAVTAIAGPGGELQRSAGPRWGKTGEGSGGIIGIEAEVPSNAEDGQNEGLLKGKVVFDFNGGGMIRAWTEEDADGVLRERMMVFRDEYYN
ncbi:aspartylglucosaminidase family protein [Arthroderma uncinatum]|uniref:aspartylglucosaminidase family protein n=1 Tax=Arthroderma uncinatum TaxID=74035 RepID=UPI00144AB2EC|nr:aspartylglucosaminidase family protein [Arthroderma uncinatum]KAF3492361.1 aspartylglucosaminidase family protein [Arthroderma uncinatum]